MNLTEGRQVAKPREEKEVAVSWALPLSGSPDAATPCLTPLWVGKNSVPNWRDFPGHLGSGFSSTHVPSAPLAKAWAHV